MRLSSIVFVWTIAHLIGCVSHEGSYLPDCIAYEGSNIQLIDGQFVWEKFTDAIKVDDDGNVIDQYPGYPLRGTYRIDGEAVHMLAESGEAIALMYIHKVGDRQYLLTAEQWHEMQSTDRVPGCALMLLENGDT